MQNKQKSQQMADPSTEPLLHVLLCEILINYCKISRVMRQKGCTECKQNIREADSISGKAGGNKRRCGGEMGT